MAHMNHGFLEKHLCSTSAGVSFARRICPSDRTSAERHHTAGNEKCKQLSSKGIIGGPHAENIDGTHL